MTHRYTSIEVRTPADLKKVERYVKRGWVLDPAQGFTRIYLYRYETRRRFTARQRAAMTDCNARTNATARIAKERQ
jgi:hypothetical protein